MTEEELNAHIEKQYSECSKRNISLSYGSFYDGYVYCYREQLKRIAELEAEVKEWKDKADLWCKTANLKDHNIMINKELEKENAELRKTNTEVKKSIRYCNRVYNDNLDYSHHIEGQLTKAKELLTKWVELFKPKGGNIPPTPIQVDTEQFLKETGK